MRTHQRPGLETPAVDGGLTNDAEGVGRTLLVVTIIAVGGAGNPRVDRDLELLPSHRVQEPLDVRALRGVTDREEPAPTNLLMGSIVSNTVPACPPPVSGLGEGIRIFTAGQIHQLYVLRRRQPRRSTSFGSGLDSAQDLHVRDRHLTPNHRLGHLRRLLQHLRHRHLRPCRLHALPRHLPAPSLEGGEPRLPPLPAVSLGDQQGGPFGGQRRDRPVQFHDPRTPHP